MVCEVVIETGNLRCLNLELCRTHVCRTLFLYHNKCTTLALCNSKCRVVGRDNHAVLELPQLCFVRAVVLTNLHGVAVYSESIVGNGVDDAPATRQLRQFPVDGWVFLVIVQKSCSLAHLLGNQVLLFSCTVDVVQLALLKSLLRIAAKST